MCFLVNGALAADTLDLSEHNFEKTIRLSGTWEFYWNQLLAPEDFKKSPIGSNIKVPGSWSRSNEHDAYGYATYRLHVLLPADHRNLSLYLPVINSSAKIWINGVLMEEIGNVSAVRSAYRAGLTTSLVALPQSSQLEIIIQVANYSYFAGGIVSSPSIGNTSILSRRLNQQRGVENFFAGSLFALFIYQIILYSLYRKGKPYLFLSLICLAVALRALTTHGGSFLLPDLFPSIGWEYWKKLEFFSVYVIVALFPSYIFHLFPTIAPRKPLLVFVGTAILLCAGVVFTSHNIYGALLDVCHVALLAGFIYAGVVIYRALRQKEKDAKIILIGVACSFPFILLEIFRNSPLINVPLPFNYLVESGVLVFLIFQVYLLASHYSQSYKNLEALNLSLEEKVSDRTIELTTANRIKDKLLSVISHDIKSPLNTLRSTLTIYNMGAVTEQEMKTLITNVDDQLGQTTMFVENILLWTKSQINGVNVNKQSFSLHELAKEHALLFEVPAEKKGIVIENKADTLLNVWADKNIISLVLRNLISNAIKFSENGKIILGTSFENGIVSLYVRDTGIGMSEEKLERIFEGAGESTYGTKNEKGTGLGLVLCMEYLKAMDSMLYAKSESNKGTMFWMTMPLSV